MPLPKSFQIILALSLFLSACASQKKMPEPQLTIKRINSSPSISGSLPEGLALSPDGTRVTYLKAKIADQYQKDLWEFNIKKNKHQMLVDSSLLKDKGYQLSKEERAYLERKRLAGQKGIVSYQWSDQGDQILFPMNGDVFVYDLKNSQARRITRTKAAETDVKFSPKGNFISYIRKQNLYVYSLKDKKEIAITRKGRGPIKYGMAEFVAQEEMGRMTGYWWAPNEKRIALTQVNEKPVELVKRYEILADKISITEQHYPFAGKRNARVSLGIASIRNNAPIKWIYRGEREYLARVRWLPSSMSLSYQTQDRAQQNLQLLRYDISSQRTQVMLEEQSKTWVNLHSDLRFLPDGHFIWSSESTGFRHFYLYNREGQLVRALTRGEWAADQVLAIDTKNKYVYFTAALPDPTQKNFYRVSYQNPTAKERLSKTNGWHEVKMSKDARYFVSTSSQVLTPPRVDLFSAEGKKVTTLQTNNISNPKHPLYRYRKELQSPKLDSFVRKNGVQLYYSLYTPPGFDKSKKYPLLVLPYGGPHGHVTGDRWKARHLWYSHLAQKGYIVINLDNRGSYRRGKAFEDYIYQNMGKPEVADQVAGVEHLISQGFVDPLRVGIMGWSYGGYLTLMSFFKRPDVFKVGVAVAPVTDWQLYDTHYTERYMGHPNKSPKSYDDSNVLNHVKKTSGHLLLIHGMADDNVLFNNSTALMAKLQDLQQPFSLMTYPGKKHAISGQNARIHVYETITRFFDRNL